MLYVEQFGKAFVPKRFRSSLRTYLMKAGWDEIEEIEKRLRSEMSLEAFGKNFRRAVTGR